jgi:hypothetical protein
MPCRPGKARRCAGLGFSGYSDARSGCGEERGRAVGEEVMLTAAGGWGLDADRAEPNGVSRGGRRKILASSAVAGEAATPAGREACRLAGEQTRCPVTPEFGDQDSVDPDGGRRQGRTRVCRSSCGARITRAIATRAARTSPRAPGSPGRATAAFSNSRSADAAAIRGTHDQQRRIEARRL